MWNKLVLALLRPWTMMLCIIVMLSLAHAACINEFTLDDGDSTVLDGTTFELLETGDHYYEVELEVGGDEAWFSSQYLVVNGWFVEAVTVTPDWSEFRASEFSTESVNSEVKMDTCGNSAVEIGGLEIVMLPSPYSHALFRVDGANVVLDPYNTEQAYVGSGYALELVSRSGSSDDGTTGATVRLKSVRGRTFGLGKEFTLTAGSEPFAVVDGNGIMLSSSTVLWRGSELPLPPAGQSMPLGSGYAVRTTALYSNPARATLAITKMATPSSGKLSLDCLVQPYGLLSDGSSVGFQKTTGSRVQLRHSDSYSAGGLAGLGLEVDSGWAFFLDSLSVSGSSCQGTLYASKTQHADFNQPITLDASQDRRFASLGGYDVFLVSADASTATLFVRDIGKNKLSPGGSLVLASTDTLRLLSSENGRATVEVDTITVPTPTATPKPSPTATPTPVPTQHDVGPSGPTSSHAPSTGLVTKQHNFFDQFVEWLASLFGM